MLAAEQQSLVAYLDSTYGAKCYKFEDAVDFDVIPVSRCSTGDVRVGYDKDGCDGKDVSLLLAFETRRSIH